MNPGFPTVVPRMVVSDLVATVAFLRTVFGATGEVESGRPAELHIGDSPVIVSAEGEQALFPAFLHIHVADVEATYCRALDCGATSLAEPANTRYGDRQAMVRDPAGNVFRIAQHRG